MNLSRFDKTVGAVLIALGVIATLTLIFARPQPQPHRVAYLAPADASPTNVWVVDPANPQGAQQLTFSEVGVMDFSPSPDGRYIAYSERGGGSDQSELMLLDLVTGRVQQLTNCRAEDATCTTPAWRSDGAVIAYQRQELNTEFGLGVSPPRIWILYLEADPPYTEPLFTDSQMLGADPVWSDDGTRLAFYESFGQGVLVFNFAAVEPEQRIRFVPSLTGSVGDLSPDGEQLLFTDLVFGGEGSQVRSVLNLADLAADPPQFNPLYDADEGLVDDGISPAWHPDGPRVALNRIYLDEDRMTPGYQVYLMDLETETISSLIFDADYNHGALHWSPDGAQLAVQRFKYGASVPEIWTYDLDTGALTLAVTNAYLPHWVAGDT